MYAPRPLSGLFSAHNAVDAGLFHAPLDCDRALGTMYRLDTSGETGRGRWDAPVRDPRPAPPVPDARLRAAQTAGAGARGAAQHLVRVALPRTEANACGRAHHHR